MRFSDPEKIRSRSIVQQQLVAGLIGLIGLTGGGGIIGTAQAAKPGVCLPDTLPAPRGADAKPGPDGVLPIEMEADQVDSVKKDLVILRGHATMQRGAQSISADELHYSRSTDKVKAKGNVLVRSAAGDRIQTDELELEVQTFVGESGPTQFELVDRKRGVIKAKENKSKDEDQAADAKPAETKPDEKAPGQVPVRARGDAAKVFFEGHDLIRLQKVRYSTCNKDQDDVFLIAEELIIDQVAGQGEATNVSIRFKNVPIFYWPKLTFPINDDRKSGFLSPQFAAGGNSGFIAGIPYYWNIAPEMDATITPRIMTNRGVQVGGEFRYMQPTYQGKLVGAVLPSDSEFGDDRAAFGYRHFQQFGERWDGDIDLQWVSDDEYFDDFVNDLNISSSTYLPQSGALRYDGSIWDIRGRVIGYQTIDPSVPDASLPYDRLPQIYAKASLPVGPYGMEWGLEGELVNFDRDDRVRGWRIDATPTVKLPIRKVYGYVVPKVSLRLTNYSLEGQAAGFSSSPNRALPIVSIDSGLFFDRNTTWGERKFLHTLEPRIFYVYIPKDNQDDIPVFDTGVSNLNNFGNMFRENRFFGADRVGDTNQVTVALTSRLVETDTGREWVKASIGQIFFLKDREVGLTPGFTDDDSDSDFLAEIRARISKRWRTYGFLQWSTDDNETVNGRVDLIYRRSAQAYVDFGYRFTRDSTEQVDVAVAWPLSDRWSMRFSDIYSIDDGENLQISAALEYDACCWTLRFGAQQRNNLSSENRTLAFIELELNGLGKIKTGL